MAINRIQVTDLIAFGNQFPILDVRSPGEFEHAHIPGATSFPLFTNEERRVVGTAYKQESRERAIKIGLDYFGKNMVRLVEVAEQVLKKGNYPTRDVVVHCWRGGMRSATVAWLLDLYGFKVNLLQAGYKGYRHWALQQFEKKYQLSVLGGFTGSNKTGLLKHMAASYTVIDLEGLAGHKGSAFGNLEQVPQPSQEMFENKLALELYRRSLQNHQTTIWLEAESQRIGTVNIPLNFFYQMRQSPLYQLNVPFESRLNFIIDDYGRYAHDKIMNAILRIKKKLGGLETKTAINFLLENDLRGCFTILLKYYDKLYLKSNQSNEFKERQIISIDSSTIDAAVNLQILRQHVK